MLHGIPWRGLAVPARGLPWQACRSLQAAKAAAAAAAAVPPADDSAKKKKRGKDSAAAAAAVVQMDSLVSAGSGASARKDSKAQPTPHDRCRTLWAVSGGQEEIRGVHHEVDEAVMDAGKST